MMKESNLTGSPRFFSGNFSQFLQNLFSNRTKAVLLVGSLSSIILIFLILIFLSFQKQSTKTQPSPFPTIAQPKPTPVASSRSAPSVFFGKYEDKSGGISTIPSTLKTYTLKTNFSLDEVLIFATKFGLTTYQPTIQPNIILYNMKDKEKRGIMMFDKASGAFSFLSYGSLAPSVVTPAQKSTEMAQVFLQDIGLLDETLSCSITYKRLDAPPTVSFVECHRDWGKVGFPIVSPLGILNLPEDVRIGNLKHGVADRLAPEDQFLTQVSTGEGKKARPDDFNTITVGLYPDGRIYSVVSNLRWIKKTDVIASQGNLITAQEALKLFSEHKSQFSLTFPAGSGVVDWDKVYHDNKAYSSKATILETSLVYLDKPSFVGQDEYSPSYLIRGVATLESGYTVRFVEAIPALSKNLSIIYRQQHGEVAGVNTLLAQDKSLQLKTFTPAPPAPEVSTMPISPTSQLSKQVYKCVSGSESQRVARPTVTLAIPGYGTAVVFEEALHTFYLKSASSPSIDIAKVKEALFSAVEEQYSINVAQYLKDNPTQISSVDDVGRVFDKINGNNRLCGSELSPPRPAPILVCSIRKEQQAPGRAYDWDAEETVARTVAQRILTASNSKKIEELASGQDLFTPQTINQLDWIFYNLLGGIKNKAMAACYVSGASPVLFLYPKIETEISVTTNIPLTYTDPSMNGMSWQVTAYPDGSIKDAQGVTRPYIYYEYDSKKVRFSEPSEGFIVERNDLNEFIENDFAKKFDLSKNEILSLLLEVERELVSLSPSRFVKIALIKKEEVDKKLPIIIYPEPDNFIRLHLVVTAVDNPQSILTPQIDEIPRNGFTVVELGAFAK